MMGSQGFELEFESCDANRRVLARLMGRYRRSTQGSEKGPAQMAKVDFYSCCTPVARVAAPPAFAPGPLDPLKARGRQAAD